MKKLLAITAFLALSAAVFAQSPNRPDPSLQVKSVLERIYGYLNNCTPYEFRDGDGKVLQKPSKADASTNFSRGDFSISCYEWGVTYSGMMLCADVLGDGKYLDYVYNRLSALGEIYPYVKKAYQADPKTRLGFMEKPRFLDDCGAMCAAMCKATLRDADRSADFRALLDRWFDFVEKEEYRLSDHILARNRPTTNSVWLDDMYMGITPIAFRGLLAAAENDAALRDALYAEAVEQVLLFKKYLWVPGKSIFRHGWIEGMAEHPDYHWARCNGWALLTMCDVLDVLPEGFPGRSDVLALFKDLIKGLAPYQAADGLWHQLLDKPESYLETSASAMFVYCIAHAVNQGWIDRTAYQDIARYGWNGVAKEVNSRGQVENTCVGTGLGWSNVFYETRPVSVYAAHGYGPVLLAGAEMIKMYSQK